MEIKVRTLENYQVKALDEIAKKNKLSRDKLVSKIVGEYLDGKNFLEAHRKFFDDEVAKIIPLFEKNNQVMEQALKYLKADDVN